MWPSRAMITLTANPSVNGGFRTPAASFDRASVLILTPKRAACPENAVRKGSILSVDDCGHALPVYHIDGRDPQTGEAKRRVSYCAQCAALVMDYRAGVAFVDARRSIPETIRVRL